MQSKERVSPIIEPGVMQAACSPSAAEITQWRHTSLRLLMSPCCCAFTMSATKHAAGGASAAGAAAGGSARWMR